VMGRCASERVKWIVQVNLCACSDGSCKLRVLQVKLKGMDNEHMVVPLSHRGIGRNS
jgi:hypothetical protein